jgi:hypothetical protein
MDFQRGSQSFDHFLLLFLGQDSQAYVEKKVKKPRQVAVD